MSVAALMLCAIKKREREYAEKKSACRCSLYGRDNLSQHERGICLAMDLHWIRRGGYVARNEGIDQGRESKMTYAIMGQGYDADYSGNLPTACLHECDTLREAESWINSYARRDMGGWDMIVAINSQGHTKIELSEFGLQYF
jgi:hypothetical protein